MNDMKGQFRYLILGTGFGFILVKSEVVSWFRIQEMFRFDSFHMYGILMSAILVAMISLQIIKRLKLTTSDGSLISLMPKDTSQVRRYLIGGALFGLGWGLTGACPGPLFALLGSGLTVISIPILFAIAGTYTYGTIRHKLPH